MEIQCDILWSLQMILMTNVLKTNSVTEKENVKFI